MGSFPFTLPPCCGRRLLSYLGDKLAAHGRACRTCFNKKYFVGKRSRTVVSPGMPRLLTVGATYFFLTLAVAS